MRIYKVEFKHTVKYYDASTNEIFHENCIKIIDQLIEDLHFIYLKHDRQKPSHPAKPPESSPSYILDAYASEVSRHINLLNNYDDFMDCKEYLKNYKTSLNQARSLIDQHFETDLIFLEE